MKNTSYDGTLDFLRHADFHLQQGSTFDRKIAFVSIDVCVESTIHTFLTLSARGSGARVSRIDVRATTDSFPQLVSLLFKVAPQRVQGLDPASIVRLHNIRTELWHAGESAIIDAGALAEYRHVAAELLHVLLGVSVDEDDQDSSTMALLTSQWNTIQSELRHILSSSGIDQHNTYKWEEAIQKGVLDPETIDNITELNALLDRAVHSSTRPIDISRTRFGMALASAIVRRLRK